MKRCLSCGLQNDYSNAKYCPECGGMVVEEREKLRPVQAPALPKSRNLIRIGVVLAASYAFIVLAFYAMQEHSLRSSPQPGTAESPIGATAPSSRALHNLQVSCAYGTDVTERAVLSAIEDERAKEKATRIVVMKSLSQYAQLLADESKEKGSISTTTKYGDYYSWAKGVNTNYEERKFDRAGGWIAAANVGTPCEVLETLASTPSRRDYLVGADTEAVGIGVSSKAVFVVVARFDKNPEPVRQPVAQPRANVVPLPAISYPPVPSIAVPSIKLPKRTTCNFNDILNTMECTEW